VLVILSEAKNLLFANVSRYKQKLADGFTEQYRIDRLVYFEETSNVLTAIERGKQIKGWLRKKKVALIESNNATWEDLSEAWYKANSTSNAKADSSPLRGSE
jgi:putative endonuclease